MTASASGSSRPTDLTIEEGDDNTCVSAEVELTQGDTALFVLEMLGDDDEPSPANGTST